MKTKTCFRGLVALSLLFVFSHSTWAEKPPVARIGGLLGIGMGYQVGDAFDQLPFDPNTTASTAHVGLAIDLGLTRQISLNLWPALASANYGSLIFVPHNIRTTSLRLPLGFTIYGDPDVGFKFGGYYHHIISSVLKPESDNITKRLELNKQDRVVSHDFGYYAGLTLGGNETVNHDILLLMEPDVFEFVFVGIVYNVSFKANL